MLFLLMFPWLGILCTLGATYLAAPTAGLQMGNWTEQVAFDNYSLYIKGQRVFLHSGEFHTFRLPVPSLWPDIMQKMKAAGLNSLSVYLYMGLHNPSRGVIDFEGCRALKPMFRAAMDAGLWIVLRPGPYINAETSAGGLPHWITAEVNGLLRTNGSDYRAAWEDYIQGVIQQTAPFQIFNGGPVIAIQVDNEYSQSPDTHAQYFAQLEEVYRHSDINLPLTYNDPGPRGNFINGTGAVDLYGLDSYPQQYDCNHPDVWRPVMGEYHSYHTSANPSQPFWFPEFQSGSHQGWGESELGYEGCRKLTGPDYLNVFNQHLWASNVKMLNYYMFYGGTSWGALPTGLAYTSYDYGASIQENRNLTTKYTEIKRQGLFLRSSSEFYKTEWIADSNTTTSLTESNDRVYVTFLKNPDTEAGFYIMRHNDSTSAETLTFKLNVTLSTGDLISVPQVVSGITLTGRQSKVALTHYLFGTSSRVVYSTAQVYFAGAIGKRDVLFLYGDASQEHEAEIMLTGQSRSESLPEGMSKTKSSRGGATVFSIASGIKPHGLVMLWDSDTQLIVYANTETASTFWAPIIAPANSKDPFAKFWQFGTNETLLVGGPYLVRSATILHKTLALVGDLEQSTTLTMVLPPGIAFVTWNGRSVRIQAGTRLVEGGVVVGRVELVNSLRLQVPVLDGWKYKDSLPEIRDGFDDSGWTEANKTVTNANDAFPMYYSDGRYLYGCSYTYCENSVLWRGHFVPEPDTSSVDLTIRGGAVFAGSVWLNNVFLGTLSNATGEEAGMTLPFPEGSLQAGKENVLTVLNDNGGLSQGSESQPKDPKGIRGFSLNSGTFGSWKVQGKIGGYTGFPDKARGVLNEGGLYGERQGWHLPGFDTSDWTKRDLKLGLPGGTAGVGFFVTTFHLDVNKDLDVAMSFTFEQELGQQYRVTLFVNGWHMGRRVANVGPQYKFPVHEGILNYRGANTIALAVWVTANTTVSPTLVLDVDKVVEGGVGHVKINNPLWSATERV